MKETFDKNPKSQFWNYTLNDNKSPSDFAMNSKKKCWFTCNKCNHNFDSSLSNISQGCWCPYCCNKQRCDESTIKNCLYCFSRCFASHEKSQFWHKTKNQGISPYQVSLHSHKKFWFTCSECKHNFEQTLTDVCGKNERWCPFCPNQKRCDTSITDCSFCYSRSFASNEKSKFWNKTKNGDIKPCHVSLHSIKKFWFTCDICFHDFYASLNGISGRNRWCPNCYTKTASLVFTWLKEWYTPEREKTFTLCINSDTGRKYRFDFFIQQINVIIEIDGRQHFQQVSNWNSSEETMSNDVTKMKFAVANELHIIRIVQQDILDKQSVWKQRLKDVLDNINKASPLITYLSSDPNIYDKHKFLYNE